MIDVHTMNGDDFRKILDSCQSNLQRLAIEHPEVIKAFEKQYEIDQKTYGRLPTFILIQTTSGIVNTTIRYSTFLKFLPIWQTRPNIIDSAMVSSIIKSPNVPLSEKPIYAEELFGNVPDNN